MIDPTTPRPRRRGILAAAALTATGLVLLPVAAEAHVRVIPDNPTSGAFSSLTFRVPNESATAGTVKVSVDLPTDNPFLYVSTKPVPGWTATTVKTKLPKPVESYGTTLTEAVSRVTWTATKGTEIGPGQFQEFAISAGPLPDPGTVLLPATQTYSDGTVAKWDQATPASGEEPEHPAPAVEVVAAATDGASPAAAEPPDTQTSAAATTADPVGRTLGGLGLAAGVAALAVAAVALRRTTGARVDA